MRFLPLLIIGGFLPQLAQAQVMGNLPHPVVMIANLSKEIAVCEAAQPVFKGRTLKYLLDIDRIAPGHLDSARLQETAQALVQAAGSKNLAHATEAACRERVFSLAEKAIKGLPCYSTRDWKECPSLRE